MDTMRIESLRPHPDNEKIYGHCVDQDFVDSIKSMGVLEPLLVTPDGLIVGGHRRYYGAKEAGLGEVPVRVKEFPDDLEIIKQLIHLNKQRERSNEVKGREALKLHEIEEERARQRQQMHGGTAPGKGKETLSRSVGEVIDDGRAWDKVGKQIGVSGDTAQALAETVTAIDQLSEQGKAEEAEELRTTLNTRGAKPARQKAKENGHVPSKKKGDSDRTKKRRQRIQRQAIPEIQELVERGELAAEPAERVAKLPVEEQERLASTNNTLSIRPLLHRR